MFRFTRAEAARLLGVSEGLIALWYTRGLVPMSGQLSIPQLFGLALARKLREQGLGHKAIGPLLSALWAMPLEELEHAIARGATCVLILGQTVCPRLLTWDACVHPAGVDKAEYTRLTGIVPRVLEVASAWNHLREQIKRLQHERDNRATHGRPHPRQRGKAHEPVASRVSPGGTEQA